MLSCMILGDSIAVGTATFSPNCSVSAKTGISSKGWVSTYIERSFGYTDREWSNDVIIISLGSNDSRWIDSEEKLRQVRVATRAQRVYWILPANKPDIQEIIKKIASEYGDEVLPIPKLSADGVHPTTQGYKELAEQIKKDSKE